MTELQKYQVAGYERLCITQWRKDAKNGVFFQIPLYPPFQKGEDLGLLCL